MYDKEKMKTCKNLDVTNPVAAVLEEERQPKECQDPNMRGV